jgi:LDH2 family malate/lactate/ureidoglycolate dehydrogenase
MTGVEGPASTRTTDARAADRVRLSVAEADRIAEAALLRLGYAPEDARIVADHLLDAALCGYEYSGLPKILEIAEAAKARLPRAPMQCLRETTVSALFDGGNHVGMIAMHHATDRAIELARLHGFSLVGVTNSWMSGRSAYYVERIARAGLVGLHTVSSASLVAPPGGAMPALGTNPIAFGFPGEPDPLVIDVGTSAMVGTELGLILRRGDELPEGVAIDSAGHPTRDAGEARRGALLPLAGHKGYALALAMKALGILAGSGLNAAKDYGYLLIVFQPDLIMPLEEFQSELASMLDRVRATPTQAGVGSIRIPSERAFADRRRNRIEGIEIDAAILASIEALGGATLPRTARPHPPVDAAEGKPGDLR